MHTYVGEGFAPCHPKGAKGLAPTLMALYSNPSIYLKECFFLKKNHPENSGTVESSLTDQKWGQGVEGRQITLSCALPGMHQQNTRHFSVLLCVFKKNSIQSHYHWSQWDADELYLSHSRGMLGSWEDSQM